MFDVLRRDVSNDTVEYEHRGARHSMTHLQFREAFKPADA